MGNDVKPIIFGGAKVYNATKTEVRFEGNHKNIYCVWLDGGAYVEYPKQKQEPVVSYFAKDVSSGTVHQITEKTFNSNQTEKDGIKYEFEKVIEECPSISSELVLERNGKKYYNQVIDGFNGIDFRGTQNPDGIYISNSSNAKIKTDNDFEKDIVTILPNCSNIKCSPEKRVDIVSKWSGYKENGGYSAAFKE